MEQEKKKKSKLKIIIPIILVIAIVIIAIVIMSKNSNRGGYNSMYTSTLDKINNMNKNSETVTEIVSNIWKETGPSRISETLVSMLTAKSEDDYIENSPWIATAIGIDYNTLSSKSKKEIYNFAKKYQDVYMQIVADQNTIEDNLKELMEKYGRKNQSEIQTLIDYFSKSKSYAQLAIDPSGYSLSSYNSSKSNFKSEIEELKQKAELYR